MIKTKVTLFLLFGLLCSGCQKDDELENVPQYPLNATLQEVYIYSLHDNNDGHVIEKYEYNPQGSISRISSPYADREGIVQYKEHSYDDEGQLATISTYHANSNSANGYILLETRDYVYDAEGFKVREVITNPEINTSKEIVFEYDGERLERTEDYSQTGALEQYTRLKYNDKGQLVTEESFSANGELLGSLAHSYANDRLSRSVHYSHNRQVIKEISRTYDKNGNLIVLKSVNIAPWLSSVSYRLEYRYSE